MQRNHLDATPRSQRVNTGLFVRPIGYMGIERLAVMNVTLPIRIQTKAA